MLPRALAFSSAGMQGAIIAGPAIGGFVYVAGAAAVDSIDVAVPVNTAYNQWTQFEEFPKFMASVEAVAMLPGNGCGGIGAITTGVLIPVRSQWRQAYLNRTFCRTFAFTSI